MKVSVSLAATALMGTFASGFSAVPMSRLHAKNNAFRTPISSDTTRTKLQHQQQLAECRATGSPSRSATQLRAGGGGGDCPASGPVSALASLWGTGGVLYILAKAIRRVLPIALEPFNSSVKGAAAVTPLTSFQLGSYIATCLWFAYVEGYKGFQKKFSPLVVKRSFTLVPGSKNGVSWYHYLFAPLYSMGLMHATRKRKIVSYSVSIGVALIVAAVKRLPYPYRNIIDAGVVAGLSWGSISILLYYVRTWITGKVPDEVSAELPEM